jgi:dTDP-4-dehydrorhamnose reductase
VFSGKRGNYRVEDTPDPHDAYGLSKLLGESIAELGRCQIIRTSIIGPELGDSGKGLMAWFLKQTGPVNGFTNHWWNGITTLEWAKIAEEILTEKLKPSTAIFQAGSAAAVTKNELLKLIGEVWTHSIAIQPTEAKEAVNRTLVPAVKRSDLRTELQEFKSWY